MPNRGLVAYVPHGSVPETARVAFESLDPGEPDVGTDPGVRGSSLGFGDGGGSLAWTFEYGDRARRGRLIWSELGVGAGGWSVAFYTKHPAEIAKKSLVSTLRFADGKPPIQLFVDGATAIAGAAEGGSTYRTPLLSGGPNMALPAMEANKFHHVALVFSPWDRTTFNGADPGTLHVFFDGQLVRSEQSTRSALSTLSFGPEEIDGTEQLSWATVDEFFVYKTSLTPSQVESLYSKPKRGLARVWPTSLPVNVSGQSPYVQARANASADTLGTHAVMSPHVEREQLASLESASVKEFTLAGWFQMPTTEPVTHPLFRIGAAEDGADFLTLAVVDGAPSMRLVGVDAMGNGTWNTEDVFAGGNEWLMRPGAWHFVAFTRTESVARVWLDGHVVAEKLPGMPAAWPATEDHFIKYGDVPTAWVATYSRALDRNDLERLRSPGPRVWLDGTNRQVKVSELSARISKVAFSGAYDAVGTVADTTQTQAVVAPNDYGSFCRYDATTKVCDPQVIYEGWNAASRGDGDTIRVNGFWGGSVRVAADDALLHGSIGTSFRVRIPVVRPGRYALFARDWPEFFARDWPSNARSWLPWDVRLDVLCDQRACALEVGFPLSRDSTKRRQIEIPIAVGEWVNVAASFADDYRPQVAVNGEIKITSTGELHGAKEVAQLPGLPGWETANLASDTKRRVRFGYDFFEFWWGINEPFDMDDMRVYARSMQSVELAALTQTCAQAGCEDSHRTCSQGEPGTTATCGDCDDATSYTTLDTSDAYAPVDRLCEAKRGFLAPCLLDVQCAQGGCTDGRCLLPERATAEAECASRFRSVREQGSHFSCGGCNEYFDEPADANVADACIWKPPFRTGDLIGQANAGIFDDNSTLGFDTYACNSGHASTVMEPQYGVDIAQANAVDQSDANWVRVFRSAQVTAGARRGEERRTLCSPAMPDGCNDCLKTPKPAYCTGAFEGMCQRVGCAVCSDQGQVCSVTSGGYPVCDNRCRTNFVKRRALLTPEACAWSFRALHDWTATPSPHFNYDHFNTLFGSTIPPVADLKRLQRLSAQDNLIALERAGVGAAYMHMADELSRTGIDRASVYENLVHKLTPGLPNPLTKQGSLKLSDCVRNDSAFFSPANDEICVAMRNPNGASCPPLNPATGRPEVSSSNGNEFCESGYCGRQTGVCTEGGATRAEVGRKDGNDSSSGSFDIAVFTVTQANESTSRHAGTGTTRTSETYFRNTLEVSALGFAVPIYNMTGTITTRAGTDPEMTTSYSVLGVPMSEPAEPLAGCSGGMWNDGSWEGSGECTAIAPDSVPLPQVAVTPACLAVPEERLKRFTKEKTFLAGPVPITISAKPAVQACVGVEAGFSAADLTGKIGFVPKLETAMEISGGIGGSIGPLEVSFGVRAAITLLELSLPTVWLSSVEQYTDPTTNALLSQWSLVSRVDVSAELTLLSLAFSIYINVDLWLFEISWEQTIVSLQGFTLKKQLYGGPRREFVLDLTSQ